jgi:hypothetical protein
MAMLGVVLVNAVLKKKREHMRSVSFYWHNYNLKG